MNVTNIRKKENTMSKGYNIRPVCGGINMLEVYETRFRTACICVSMILPLERGSAAARALVPYVLKSSCSAYANDLERRQAMALMYGAELGVSVSRLGDLQQICLSVTALDDRCTIDGEKLSERCAELLCDVLLRPHTENGIFRESDIEREKQIMREKIEAERNDKIGYTLEKCIQASGENEPFGVPVKGTAEEVAALTAAQTWAAYRELLETARIDIVAVGALEFGGIAECFAAKLSALERRPAELPENIIIENGSGRSVEERLPVAQTNMALSLRMSADVTESAGKLMSVCLGGSPSSLLFKRVREELSLCYFCSSAFSATKRLLYIISGLADEKLDESLSEIRAQIKLIADGGLTTEDIDAAKLTLCDSLHQAYDSMGSMVGWYRTRLLDDVIYTPEQQIELYQAVTADEIAAAARTLSEDVVYAVRPSGDAAETGEDE